MATTQTTVVTTSTGTGDLTLADLTRFQYAMGDASPDTVIDVDLDQVYENGILSTTGWKLSTTTDRDQA